MAWVRKRTWVPWVGLLVLYLAALGIPRLIPDGVVLGQASEAGQVAQYARDEAGMLWSNPLEQLWITKVSVRSITLGQAWPGADWGDWSRHTPAREFRAILRAYTFFGLPYSEAVIQARSGSVWRSPAGALSSLALLGATILLLRMASSRAIPK